MRFASKRERGSKHLYRQAKSLLLDNSTSLGIGHSLRVSIVGYRELFLEHLSFTVQSHAIATIYLTGMAKIDLIVTATGTNTPNSWIYCRIFL